jgi:hypothetical protein
MDALSSLFLISEKRTEQLLVFERSDVTGSIEIDDIRILLIIRKIEKVLSKGKNLFDIPRI